ncbi:glutathione binding-like protein [Paracoccaceae bacterium]|nr:glutathione binding-like protein [Paracoccaceae bacterium]
MFWRVIRTAAAEHNQPAIRAAVTTLEHKLAIAEAQLGRNKFLAGNSLCLADVQFGHILYRYYNIEITRKALPNLARYYGVLPKGRPIGTM